MTNSADNSNHGSSLLNEDSDVIELTEEVQSEPGVGAFLDDDLDFSMPEFRLPDEPSEPLDATQRLDPAQIDFDDPNFNTQLFGQETAPADLSTTQPVEATPRPEETTDQGVEARAESLDKPQKKPATFSTMRIDLSDVQTLEEMSFEEMSMDELPAAEPPAQISSNPLEDPPAPEVSNDYDREEMVRTIQMQAVDRDAIERQIDRERLEQANVVTTHQHAPDALIEPPRVLTRRWQEWQGTPGADSPAAAAKPAGPRTGPPPSLRGTKPPNNRTTGQQRPLSGNHPSVQRPPGRSAPTPMMGKPPVTRSSKPPEEPTPQQAPQQPQQPARQPATAPPQQQAPTQQPQQPVIAQQPQQPVVQNAPRQPAPPKKTGDEEIDGLVQELLDESNKKEKAAQKAANPGKPGRDVWFKEVFNEEYFRTIPPNYARQTEREIDFIDKSLSLQSGARILDLACGYGRHAVSLASRQFEVVGLDLSMEMLQRALALAQTRGLSIKFIHGDMRSLNFNGIFDGCLLWQSSFGYFDDITNFKVLQGIWRTLKPGARFLLDIVNRDHVIAEMPARCWWEGQDCIFLEEVDFDPASSILHTKRSFIYEDGSAPLEQNMYMRLYSLHEISNLVSNAGFRILEISGEIHHRGRFLGPSNSRIVILAEKKMPPA